MAAEAVGPEEPITLREQEAREGHQARLLLVVVVPEVFRAKEAWAATCRVVVVAPGPRRHRGRLVVLVESVAVAAVEAHQ